MVFPLNFRAPRVAAAFAAVLALVLMAALLVVPSQPAGAIEGGSTAANTKFNRSTVRVTTSGSTCSGVLVARDMVLTAEHCVRHDIPNPAPHPPRQGYSDWELPDRFYDVRHVLPDGVNVLFGRDSNNPMLAAKAYEYSLPGDIDIMLLRLTEPVPSSVANPVDVVTDWGMNANKTTAFLAEQSFKVFGYGKTSDTSNFSNIQQEGRSDGATFPCPTQQDGWQQGDVHRMCLKGADGTGVRSGDSGGPAYWFDATGKRHVVGIFQGLESFHNGGRYVALWYDGGRSANGDRRGDVAGWLQDHLTIRLDYGPTAVPSADFDGNNRPDIVRENGIWYVSGSTRTQLVSAKDMGRVRVGNFDGDRADELLWTQNGKWLIQNLDGSVRLLNRMPQTVNQLRFADLNGDGVTDILYRDNAKERLFISWSGTSDWTALRKNLGGPKLSKLRLLDIDGDEFDDIVTGIGNNGRAKISFGGGTKWLKQDLVECEQTLRVLDFKGLGLSGSVTRHC